jgi:O-antigen/teichoic acid export membrane protein
VGIAVLLIPVTTSFLSPAEAGLWFSFQGLVAMVSMIDLGFGFAISRQAAFTLGTTEPGKATDDFINLAPGAVGVHQLFGLTRKLYAALAAIGAVVSLIAYEVLSRVGNLIPSDTPGTRLGWYGIAVATVFIIFTGGYSSFLNGIGSVYQTRFTAGFYQLFAGIGAGVAAWLGGGLPLMAASFACCAVIYLAVISYLLRKAIPNVMPHQIADPAKGSLRRLAKAALPVGAVNIFGSCVYMVQPPMIGLLLGPEKVLPFYLAQKIGLAFNMLSMQLALPQLPFFTRALGKGDKQEISFRLNRTVKTTTLIVISTSLMYYLSSPWFAKVLLNKSSYVDSETLAILALDFFVLGLTGIGGQFVLASGRNPFMVSTIFTGITSLSLTAILTPEIGVIGLPIATLIAGLLFNYRKCFVEYRKLKITHGQL